MSSDDVVVGAVFKCSELAWTSALRIDLIVIKVESSTVSIMRAVSEVVSVGAVLRDMMYSPEKLRHLTCLQSQISLSAICSLAESYICNNLLIANSSAALLSLAMPRILPITIGLLTLLGAQSLIASLMFLRLTEPTSFGVDWLIRVHYNHARGCIVGLVYIHGASRMGRVLNGCILQERFFHRSASAWSGLTVRVIASKRLCLVGVRTASVLFQQVTGPCSVEAKGHRFSLNECMDD
uniref:Transmembrane protein n=1 Tax=Ascaris lumbricoides TaxID=6252 RepID=A0A0M3I5M1_ASCLU